MKFTINKTNGDSVTIESDNEAAGVRILGAVSGLRVGKTDAQKNDAKPASSYRKYRPAWTDDQIKQLYNAAQNGMKDREIIKLPIFKGRSIHALSVMKYRLMHLNSKSTAKRTRSVLINS